MTKKLEDFLQDIDGKEFEFSPVSVKMNSGDTVLMLMADLDDERYIGVDPLQSIVHEDGTALKPWNAYTDDKFFIIHHKDVSTMNAMSEDMYRTYQGVLKALYDVEEESNYSTGEDLVDLYDDLFHTWATSPTLH